MSKARRVGIVLTLGTSCVLALMILLVVSPLMMLGAALVLALLAALLWRLKPRFVRALFPKKKQSAMPDIGSALRKEVILSDMVLCPVDAAHAQTIHISKKLMIVGVAEGCDVVLPRDCGVSRIHAKLFYSNRHKRFLVEDNDSSSGTYLNGVRLSKGRPQLLCKGDRLRFAQMEFEVKSAYYR